MEVELAQSQRLLEVYQETLKLPLTGSHPCSSILVGGHSIQSLRLKIRHLELEIQLLQLRIARQFYMDASDLEEVEGSVYPEQISETGCLISEIEEQLLRLKRDPVLESDVEGPIGLSASQDR